MRLHRTRNAKGLRPISAQDNEKRRKAFEAEERRQAAWNHYVSLKREHEAQTPSLMLRMRAARLRLVLWIAVLVILSALVVYLVWSILPRGVVY